jgi:hypothetical protein
LHVQQGSGTCKSGRSPVPRCHLPARGHSSRSLACALRPFCFMLSMQALDFYQDHDYSHGSLLSKITPSCCHTWTHTCPAPTRRRSSFLEDTPYPIDTECAARNSDFRGQIRFAPSTAPCWVKLPTHLPTPLHHNPQHLQVRDDNTISVSHLSGVT